ncbi:MAG: HAMP domain-containing sensor histidine kinase [Clostridia bacterium]|nr:HAMP domain-containing sensor histidine kinase [Clostridia bacterium]
MSNKRQVKDNLRTKFFVSFAIYGLLLALVVWWLLISANDMTDRESKMTLMEDATLTIIQSYKDGTRSVIDEIAQNQSMEIYIFLVSTTPAGDETIDFDAVNHYAYTSTDEPQMPLDELQLQIEGCFRALTSGDSTSASESRTSQLLHYEFFVGEEQNRYFLFCSQSVELQEGILKMLSTQLIWITLICFALSIVMAFIMSKRLSNPIVNMSNMAHRLAKGDYSVRFSGKGYNEIELLSQSLNHTTQELSKLEGLRRDIVANVSHDLKTPLTVIKSSAEMLAEFPNVAKDKRKERLNIILKEVDRMTQLISSMTQLSLSESNSIKPNKEAFSLSKLLLSVLESLSVKMDSYDVTRKITDNLFVYADRSQISQVLFNFIDNALKYTGEDKKVIIMLTEKDGTARFDCIDSGNTLKEEDVTKIWDRYYRSSEQYSRKSQGTGLGLSIVKNILVGHESNYGVKLLEKGGSDFYFELPLIIKLYATK